MKMRIRTKLILISAILLVIPSLVIGLSGYTLAKNSLNDIGAQGLKNDVNLAIDLLESLQEQVDKGALSLKEAQEIAKDKLIGPLQEDGTRTIQSEVDMGQHGYFFVLGDDGVALAHPVKEGEDLSGSKTKEGMMTTMETIKTAQNGGGFLTFDFAVPGTETVAPKIVYTQVFQQWGWNVVAGSYLMDFNSESKGLLMVLAVVLGISLLIGAIVIILFSGHLSKPLIRITDHVARVADGDLSGDVVQTRNRDEIGELALYTNRMSQNLKEMIEQVSSASMQVAATSEELSASSEETSKSVEHVSESIQELAGGIDGQLEQTEIVNKAAMHLSSDMHHVEGEMERAKNTVYETVNLAEEGSGSVTRVENHMETIQSETDSAFKYVNELGSKSAEIGKIAGLITNVAEQTNLLALNAAIEAARAGENGRGFAVVADEVRKLAEQSSNAATQVGTLIGAIQQDIGHSVSAIGRGNEAVEMGAKLVEETGAIFTKISQAIQGISEQIQEVTTGTAKNRGESERMASIIEQTATIAMQSANHVENISASAQQQTASMEEIAAASETLSQMAEGLQESIRRFNI
ncbi:methyl-accepting chemotaxis protein [Sporosarcina gallistercoris]|uniref:Cache domain-containing protein n=1 Tax=Sporosarcina gallistercoris TaxID=2762245 RepID=A0ABR8PIT9_9BACL|nr:methyl-accepting chemotaxis protein [Sporosarcina gallistercoris]MBD7908077.1 cache domain-containing protein [Sporosarcina gallistercoris]